MVDGALEALHRIEHAGQSRAHGLVLHHGGGQLFLQQIEKALDVGDGGFEVVRSGVDEVVQVHIRARELRVGGGKLGIGRFQLPVDGGQLVVEFLHPLAVPDLGSDVGAHRRHAGDGAIDVAQGLVHVVQVHGLSGVAAQ